MTHQIASEKTIKAYNKNAEAYLKKFSNYELYTQKINRFADEIVPYASVLDLGCGPGSYGKIFTDKGHSVFGLDLSKEMIKLAKDNCPKGHFLCSSVSKIPWKRTFDAICLSFLIVHLNDKETKSLLNSLPVFSTTHTQVYISFMSGKTPGFEKTSFSDEEIFFNYYVPENVISIMRDKGFSLYRWENAPYIEKDGSVTTDHFLIFRFGQSKSENV